MRNQLFVMMLAVLAGSARAADADTVCATLYTYLADEARIGGASAAVFEAAALKAQQAHMQRNSAEDVELYVRSVIDGAAAIRAGLDQGAITKGSVQLTTTRCNNHYFPGEGQQLAFPDDWWAEPH